MKVLLTTLNSKFIHSNLAIRYLKSYTPHVDTDIIEFNINQPMDYILGEIYKGNYDIIGISTYIWNIEEVIELSCKLKIVQPDIKIILGGPEVSFNSYEFMKKNDSIDFIIKGEGEETYRELMDALDKNEENFSEILGIVYRDNTVFENNDRPLIKDLNTIPSPYSEDDDLTNKIVYLESSRGCPFNCSFCLSSTIQGIRFFDINRVKKDISLLISKGVSQVKFVDRTFNAAKSYSIDIMNYIIKNDPIDLNFHFEVTAHLLDDEMLEFLKKPKAGLFQFEIGVQSTNEKTINSIGRDTDFAKLSEVVKTIKSYGNIHQHLDLIVGLPYEYMESFRNSFNDVFSLDAEKLQVGFLKLLKGSELRKKAGSFEIVYYDRAPYEVLETSCLSYGELLDLKNFEEVIERFHNEEYLKNSIKYLIESSGKDPFSLYFELSKYWVESKYNIVAVSRDDLYRILIDFAENNIDVNMKDFIEIVKYDYYLNNNQHFNKIYKNGIHEIENPKLHSILKDEVILRDFLPDYKDIPTKKIINKIRGVYFTMDIEKYISSNFTEIDYVKTLVLFDYTKKMKINTFVYKEQDYEYIKRS